MQLEWNRFLEGVMLFKQQQGLVWLCCVAGFVILFCSKKERKNPLWITMLLMGCMILFPVTALVLLKGFTPYYDWLDLQAIFPVALLMGYLGLKTFDYLKEKRIPGIQYSQTKNKLVAAVSVVCLFAVATTFHAFGAQEKADASGVPMETSKVFTALSETVDTEKIVLAAPSDMLSYTRLYNPEWQPLYGRDLWNSKAASYIDSGYTTEYQYYEFLNQMEPRAEERDDFIALIEEGMADCIIVPEYWSVWLLELDGYEVVTLTDSYVGIIKKELLIG